MTYAAYDAAAPTTSSLGTDLPAEVLDNTNALRDMVIMGQASGFAFSTSGGSAEEPQYWLFKNGTTWIRATPTWSSGKVTACTWEKSTNSGGAYDAIQSAQAFTYDGSGNLTAVTNASGAFSLFWYALAKLKTLYTSYTAHNGGAVWTYHSGVGTIASQAASSVSISGGSIDGTAIGGTTPAAVTAQTYKGKCVNLGSTITGSTAVDWSLGDYFYGTFTGAGAALTFSNLPAADRVQGITIEINNAALATSPWPTVKWPNGTAPTRGSGIDVYEFFCRDGSTVRGLQAAKNSA